MSQILDEFVPATPDSVHSPVLLPHRPGMLRLHEFQYHTPGNSPVRPSKANKNPVRKYIQACDIFQCIPIYRVAVVIFFNASRFIALLIFPGSQVPLEFAGVDPDLQSLLDAPVKNDAGPPASPPPVIFPNVRRKLNWAPRRVRENRQKPKDFKDYIYRVLRKLDPKGTISSKAMIVMNDLIVDMFHKLATECGELCKHNKRSTLDVRELQAVVRLFLPGELGKHAFAEGFQALRREREWAGRNP